MLTISLALCCYTIASAQSKSAPAANAVLISETKSGNTVTSHYVVRHDTGKSANFDVHYAISRAKIVPSYSDNTQQIADLKEFMGETQDTTMHISAIHIIGYSSPDGNTTHNDSLAMQRAQALYQYTTETYHPVQHIDTSYKTFSWQECAKAVEASNIPHKSEVLTILNSNYSEPSKEYHLRQLHDAWVYLATNILPSMRYADIAFDYGKDEFFTRTTTIPTPAPTTQTKTQTQPTPPAEIILVDEEEGIIIATPKEEYNNKKRERKTRNKRGKTYEIDTEVLFW